VSFLKSVSKNRQKWKMMFFFFCIFIKIGFISFNSLLKFDSKNHSRLAPLLKDIKNTDVHNIQFTSGTTGLPKVIKNPKIKSEK